MKVDLPDVNVLVALAWPTHVHHSLAHDWFGEHALPMLATCPHTECGFVRASSNGRSLPHPVTVASALAALRMLYELPNRTLLTDGLSLLDSRVPTALMVGHQQVSDAYLLGLAIAHGARLVTLDRAIEQLLPRGSAQRQHLALIEDVEPRR